MSGAWWNGALVEGPLGVSPAERGLLLGDGLFETIAVVLGVPLWLTPHLDRLQRSAHECGIAFDRGGIETGIGAVLAQEIIDFGALRVTLMRGAGQRGLATGGEAPSLLIGVTVLARDMMFSSCSLGLVDVVRHSKSPATRLKSISYFDNVMAARLAHANGFDEALMLNEHGLLACASIGNVFLVSGKHLITPDLGQGILPGITRKIILELGHKIGMTVQESACSLTMLEEADGAFITNSLRLLRPVTRFGDRGFSQHHTKLISELKSLGGL